MRTSPLWRLPLGITQGLGVWLVFTAYCIFPNGRFVPAWTRLLVPVALLISLPAALAAPLPMFARVAAILLLVGVSLQIYRFRQVFTASERQQSKWVLLGTTVLATFLVALNFTPVVVPAVRAPGMSDVLYVLVGATMTVVVSLLYVACAAITLLKYRLFDINVLVTRTLVYTALTASLAMLYVASVVIFQSAFQVVIGQESDLAIISSTLVIAVAFQPLRRQLQTTIDRRFYRRRYDAAQALAHFAAVARDEVDLDRLAERLLGVAEETLQPTHVSLWLRPTRPSEPSRYDRRGDALVLVP